MGAHLGGLFMGAVAPSKRFRGGQAAADAALDAFAVRGYASRRSEVWPVSARGASGLSPWIRHGLITLPRAWAHVDGGPARDVDRFRDELMWQEYARHVYARLGQAIGRPLRAGPPPSKGSDPARALDPRMACLDLVVGELERDGWMVNQSRMWLASQWAVRHGLRWQDGELWMRRRLLDGSRAANALGWQWTVGTATGRRYGFAKGQVERRAPGVCDSCELARACPIAAWPPDDVATAAGVVAAPQARPRRRMPQPGRWRPKGRGAAGGRLDHGRVAGGRRPGARREPGPACGVRVRPGLSHEPAHRAPAGWCSSPSASPTSPCAGRCRCTAATRWPCSPEVGWRPPTRQCPGGERGPR